MTDFFTRCRRAIPNDPDVTFEATPHGSVIVKVASSVTLVHLGQVILDLHNVGRVRFYHEAITSIASRLDAGAELTLVVEEADDDL